MIKHAIFALLLAASGVFAAPTMVASPYPATGAQPVAAVFTVNGGAPIPCTLVAVTGGLQPTCNLVSITAPGTYTLVMTVTSNAGCVNTPNAATCVGAGSASSAPFAYSWQGSVVPTPALQISP